MFGLKLRLELIIIGLFLDSIFEPLMDCIFTEHISFDLLDLFKNSLLIFIIILVEFITVGLDSIPDKIKDFIGHIGLTDTHGDLLIISICNLSNDGVKTFKVLD